MRFLIVLTVSVSSFTLLTGMASWFQASPDPDLTEPPPVQLTEAEADVEALSPRQARLRNFETGNGVVLSQADAIIYRALRERGQNILASVPSDINS